MARSRVLNVWVSAETYRRLEQASEEKGRSVGELAEAAVEEEALRWERSEILRGEQTRGLTKL